MKQTPTAHGIDEAQRSKINDGLHLHAGLANVKFAPDIDRVLFQMESNGLINKAKKKQLDLIFSTWMTDPQIADWFSDRWNVQTEVVALLPGGKELRIDRLLLKNEQAIVIDYKTGNASPADHKQVAAYCDLLNGMGFQSQGYLLYLSDGKVQQVAQSNGKENKEVKQLGFDL